MRIIYHLVWNVYNITCKPPHSYFSIGLSVKVLLLGSCPYDSFYCMVGLAIQHTTSRAVWQESHENEHKPCELLVLFSSCGTLSAGSRTDNRSLPRQTIPEPHKNHHDIIHKYDVSFAQWWLSPSMKPSHIIPQGPHHHQELFKRSPVGFLLKSTGNQPRSWVQD